MEFSDSLSIFAKILIDKQMVKRIFRSWFRRFKEKATTFLVWTILALNCIPKVSYAVDDYTPGEILVTSDQIFDFEFHYANPSFTWIDQKDGKIWIGCVDQQTGDFLPPDGKAVFVDTDGIFLGNGSEWAASSQGDSIIYTKNLPDGVVSLAQAKLINGIWTGDFLRNGKLRINPLASVDPEDKYSTILYLLPIGNDTQIIAWRELDFPASEKRVPMSNGATGGRWVSGRRAIVFTAPFRGGRQAFLYECDTETIERLTFDSGNKQTIFMWQAPELDDEYIFFTTVKLKDASVIRIYRKMDADQGGEVRWAVYKTIKPSQTGIYFFSPEIFIHNGKSYLFWQASRSSDHKDWTVPAQIWLSNIDPVNSFVRNLTLGENRRHMDPEVFVTEQGPFIYYNRYLPGPDSDRKQNFEGIYRVDTGLGPVMSP